MPQIRVPAKPVLDSAEAPPEMLRDIPQVGANHAGLGFGFDLGFRFGSTFGLTPFAGQRM